MQTLSYLGSLRSPRYGRFAAHTPISSLPSLLKEKEGSSGDGSETPESPKKEIPMVSSYLGIAIGNTTLRWSFVREDDRTATGIISVEDPVPEELRSAAAQAPVYAASVNPPRLQRLGTELPAAIVLIGRDIPIPLRNETRRPEQVGSDRLLTALGAWQSYGPAVVVDIGTAVTVDLVTAGPAFRGGAIIPGPRLWAHVLSRQTALLPDVPVAEAPPPLGRDTEEAIATGTYWGIVGAVRLLIDRIGTAGSTTTVCVTGGGAPLFASALGSAAIHDPDLIFTGLRATVARERT